MTATLAAVAAATALAAPAATLLTHRALRRAQAAKALRIGSERGIDEQGFVRIGGIDQWISVRGEDRTNPVLVEIHGGPGAANSIYTARTRGWERHFTIVRWDMRGAGKTFGRGGPQGQGEATFEQLYEDALEVTRYARDLLGAERVVLLANSYGSVFGLRLARNHPELYSAYVGTDQNIHTGGRDTSAHDALRERLRAAGKAKRLAQVEAIGADPRAWTPQQQAEYAKISAQSDPLTLTTLKKVVLGSMWLSPLHSLRDLRDFLRGQSFSERITEGTAGLDDRADGTRFEIPFFVFQGEHDVLTPTAAAKAFFDEVEAPVKRFALIEGCSHFAAYRRPDRFLELLLTHVRPAVTAERPCDAWRSRPRSPSRPRRAGRPTASAGR